MRFLRLWKYYAMLIVVHTIGRLPLRWRYGFSRVVSDRVYDWRRSIRESVRSNARHVLGPDASEEEVDRVARAMARNTGRNYVCRMIIRRASRFGGKAGFAQLGECVPRAAVLESAPASAGERRCGRGHRVLFRRGGRCGRGAAGGA